MNAGESVGGADLFVFFLIAAVVVSTSFWVWTDARSLGLAKSRKPSKAVQPHAELDPAGWFLFCLMVWVVAFPMYLVKRRSLTERAVVRRNHRPRPHQAR